MCQSRYRKSCVIITEDRTPKRLRCPIGCSTIAWDLDLDAASVKRELDGSFASKIYRGGH